MPVILESVCHLLEGNLYNLSHQWFFSQSFLKLVKYFVICSRIQFVHIMSFSRSCAQSVKYCIIRSGIYAVIFFLLIHPTCYYIQQLKYQISQSMSSIQTTCK